MGEGPEGRFSTVGKPRWMQKSRAFRSLLSSLRYVLKSQKMQKALKPILRSKGFCWVDSEPFRASALFLRAQGDSSPRTP